MDEAQSSLEPMPTRTHLPVHESGTGSRRVERMTRSILCGRRRLNDARCNGSCPTSRVKGRANEPGTVGFLDATIFCNN